MAVNGQLSIEWIMQRMLNDEELNKARLLNRVIV